MAGWKSRCLRASNRRPLPVMSALRAPKSSPLMFRGEISQGNGRRCVGNLSVDQKENLCASRSSVLPAEETNRALTQGRCDVAAVDGEHRAGGLGRLGERDEALRHVLGRHLEAEQVA